MSKEQNSDAKVTSTDLLRMATDVVASYIGNYVLDANAVHPHITVRHGAAL